MDSAHVLAGYRVAARTGRLEWQDESLPDGDLVSLSECVVDVVAADTHGWDPWFGSAEEAAAARGRADADGSDVLAVGLAASDVAALLADIADGGWDASAGSLPGRLARREPFPHACGPRLGFELVGYDCGLWHTWTCLGGLVADVREATGVRPGRWGLVQDEADARRAARSLTDSGAGDPKVFLWAAALIARVA
ncbi:hypothetical protein ACQP1W_44255 [Spirillospora sp. CA-255316]